MMRSDSMGSSGNCSTAQHGKQLYIYDLPSANRQQLCEHLDALRIWKQLAKEMQLRSDQIFAIQHKESIKLSPTEELLEIWSSYNHYVDELYAILHNQKLFQAMRIIKDFVSPTVRTLRIIPNSLPDLTAILRNQTKTAKYQPTKKLLNCNSSSGVSNSLNQNTRDNNCTTTSSSSMGSHQSDSMLLSEFKLRAIAGSIKEFKYDELSKATNNWHENNVLGKGGFGTVYKGTSLHTEIAIKRLDYRGNDSVANSKVQIKQSLNELKYLYACRHDNLLPLYGYCIRGEKPCLVYQYMEYGSLDRRLHDSSTRVKSSSLTLTFQQRIEISLGISRGINWIHTREKPLIHGDIKPANVLLDRCLTPKIGDFGLAREGPDAIKTAVKVAEVYGTKCYLPPEFLKLKKLSTQVDTYSFGVTLFEMFTGQRAYTKNRSIPLLTDYVRENYENIVDMLDSSMTVTTEEERNICKLVLNLGHDCIAADPLKRPDMEYATNLLTQQNFNLKHINTIEST